MTTVMEKAILQSLIFITWEGRIADIDNADSKIFLKCMIIFALGQEGPGMIINGYHVEIQAVRYTQITDDGRDTGKQLALL